jgi:hypothetical protein
MITLTYKTTRPNTSAPFFVDSPDHVQLVTRWTELSDALDIKPIRLTSDDTLETVTTFLFESQEMADMYYFVVQENLPDWLETRNLYYVMHGHSLVAERLTGNGELSTFFTI